MHKMYEDKNVKTQEFIDKWAKGYPQRRLAKLERRMENLKESKLINLEDYKQLKYQISLYELA